MEYALPLSSLRLLNGALQTAHFAVYHLYFQIPDRADFCGPQLSFKCFHFMYRLRHDQRRALCRCGEVEGSAFRKNCPVNQFVSTVRVRGTVSG